MPRDKRLYMTFPIDFHRHPKLQRLSVEARWTFVEMNGEARIAENDGRFEAEEAEFLWSREHLTELLQSHPSRPLLVMDGTVYVIREYPEHQFTKADRDQLTEKRAKAGRASAAKRSSRGEHVLSRSEHPATESESESGLDNTKTSTRPSSSNPPNAGTDGISATVLQGLNISPTRLVTHIKSRTDRDVTTTTALSVALHLLDKVSGEVRTTNQQYVLGSITKSWAEVQQYIDESESP